MLPVTPPPDPVLPPHRIPGLQRFERARPHSTSDPPHAPTLYHSMRLRWAAPARAAGTWQLAQMHPPAPCPLSLASGWGLPVLLSLCCCFALLRLIFPRLLSPACDFVRCPCLVAAAPAAAHWRPLLAAVGAQSPQGCTAALAPAAPAVRSCTCACSQLHPHTLSKKVSRRRALSVAIRAVRQKLQSGRERRQMQATPRVVQASCLALHTHALEQQDRGTALGTRHAGCDRDDERRGAITWAKAPKGRDNTKLMC